MPNLSLSTAFNSYFKMSRPLFPLALSLALGACGVAKTQQQVDDAVSEAVGEEIQAGNTFQAAGDSSAAQSGWLDSFADEKLNALVGEAIAHNRDLRVSAGNVIRAQALAGQAGAALLPSADVSLGPQRSGSFDDSVASSGSTSAGLQLSWELDLWGRLSAGERAATANQAAAEADYIGAQLSLAAAVAKSYFTAIEARSQIDVAQNSLDLLNETLRIVNVRFENGVGFAQDVSLAKADVAAARESLSTVELSYRDAVRALELLLGRYPGADADIPKQLPAVPAPPPVGLPSELLERRPDLVAAERRVAAAFDAVNQSQAARLPSLGLTASLGGSSSSLSSLLDPSNLTWMAGSNLLAPLFDGGKRREQVRIATAEQDQALANYGQLALTAFGEVESTLEAGETIASRYRDLEEASKEYAEAFRIAQLRYKEGESELIDVLSIQQRVNASKRSLSSIERLQLEQRVNLHLALGGGF